MTIKLTITIFRPLGGSGNKRQHDIPAHVVVIANCCLIITPSNISIAYTRQWKFQYIFTNFGGKYLSI